MSEHLDPEQLLSAARNDDAVAHAESCAECRRLLDGLRRLRAKLLAAPPAEISPALAARIERRASRPRSLLPIWLPALAMSALLVAGAWWRSRVTPTPDLEDQPERIAKIVLPDGGLIINFDGREMHGVLGNGLGGLGILGNPKPVSPVKSVVLGSIDKDAVRDVVDAHRDEVRACYTAALAKKPDLTGKLLMQFAVAGNGSVIDTAVRSSTVPPELAECVARKARSWEFAPSTGTFVVSYPFVFAPR